MKCALRRPSLLALHNTSSRNEIFSPRFATKRHNALSQTLNSRNIQLQYRNTIVPFASQGPNKQPAPEDDGNGKKNMERSLLLSLIVQYPATRGTFAVILGYLFHVDPLGTLHWSESDALVGCAFALLPSLLDSAILLPNWEPKRTTRTMKMMVPKAVADKINAKTLKTITTNESDENENKEDDGGLVEIERTVNVRADQHPLRDALLSIQTNRIMSNVGRALSPPSEALLLFLVHFSEEMLYRGVLLVVVVRWITDNLYYSGMEEFVQFPGGAELSLAQLGAVGGGVLLTVVAVGLLVQRELFPLRVADATKERLQALLDDKKEKEKNNEDKKAKVAALFGGKVPSEEEKKKEQAAKKEIVVNLLEQLQTGVVNQQKWIVAVEAAVEFLQWSTLSAGFLVTGNILTPLAGSMVNDLFYSAFQRIKQKKIEEMMKARAQESGTKVKETAELLRAVRDHRRQKLKPLKGMGPKADSEEEKEKEKVSVGVGSSGLTDEETAAENITAAAAAAAAPPKDDNNQTNQE